MIDCHVTIDLHPDVVDVLDRELYSVEEAARLLRMRPRTLHSWIHGAQGHAPVLRPARDASGVTWGEFVEAAYLGFYRRERSTSLQQLRRSIAGLRRRHPNVRYPLATLQPATRGNRLVADIGGDLEDADSGQLLLDGRVMRHFMDAVDWERDIAVRLRPDPENGLVTTDPERSFGIPTVAGIRTEILWELFESGESVAGLGELYGLESAEVEAAIRFEATRA